MKKKTKKSSEVMVKRGRRNRQRGAELQRQAVNIAKDYGLQSFNRDRGGAQHEQGDIEIDGKYYGCKRRKKVPAWVLPEKEEHGVVFRMDRDIPYISIPYDTFCFLLQVGKKWEQENKNGK